MVQAQREVQSFVGGPWWAAGGSEEREPQCLQVRPSPRVPLSGALRRAEDPAAGRLEVLVAVARQEGRHLAHLHRLLEGLPLLAVALVAPYPEGAHPEEALIAAGPTEGHEAEDQPQGHREARLAVPLVDPWHLVDLRPWELPPEVQRRQAVLAEEVLSVAHLVDPLLQAACPSEHRLEGLVEAVNP